MTPHRIKNEELDRLISNALASNNDMMVPVRLSDKTIRKLEKKIVLRELVLELLFKVALVFGSLGILAGVLAWVKGAGVLAGFYNYLVNNWKMISSLLFVALVTLLIDQVVLKFYETYKSTRNLKHGLR